MKTTNENEMDLLLRALGRDAASRSKTGSVSQSSLETEDHLDADQLNCYAEGVVSNAERLRYNKHLADCDRCRSIVAGLVPALPRRHEALKPETGWSLREKLAALFAPSVLRFAVPALALTVIIAIAIVALRRPQQTDFVAQNEQQAQAPSAVSGSGESQTTTAGPQSALSPDQRQVESNQRNALSDQKSAASQPQAIAPNTSSSKTANEREAKGPVEPSNTSVAQSQPTFAAEPGEAAAPPPPPRPASLDASKAAEARKKEEDADLQKRRRDENVFQASRSENEVARGGPTKGGPSRNNSGNVAGISSVLSRQANKDDRAADSAVETRKVSGRLFHREGNAWVDADYASGRATVNVKRGSEQFRALIADEPGLRSISEQLGGEVIVVWKGTAYRIR
jgi:hypothetical protein